MCADFGGFEVYVDGTALSFGRAKAKELLAYFVDRRGAGVTTREACAVLWEDAPYDTARKNYFQTVVADLRASLREAGLRISSAAPATVWQWPPSCWSATATAFWTVIPPPSTATGGTTCPRTAGRSFPSPAWNRAIDRNRSICSRGFSRTKENIFETV